MKELSDFAYGIEPNDWPKLHLNNRNAEAKPIIRVIDVQDRNVTYSKQQICQKINYLFTKVAIFSY